MDPAARPVPVPRRRRPAADGAGPAAARSWQPARARRPRVPPPPGDRPFAGLRVLDFTAFWAGPFATAWLSSMGADVMKVEAVQRPDGIRFSATVRPHDDPQFYEKSALFHACNLGKRGITLDLGHPDGLAIAKRFVERSDVVAENFTPQVLERFGLDWETVHALNPAAIMLRMPAFGLDGPWRARGGFAQTMEQLTGMAWVTGYEGGPPIIPGGPVDPMVGAHAALAVVAALEHRGAHRRRTARGGAARRGRDRGHRRAGDPLRDRRDVARTTRRGRGVRVRGRRRLGRDRPGARSDDARRARGVVRDAYAGRRGTRRARAGRPGRGDGARLRDARRPADARPRVLRTGRQPARRSTQHYPTWPVRLSAGPQRVWTAPAPTLGQHTAEVLGGELGIDDDELARLEAEHVIGTTPVY